jgi:hypothetical protein
MDEINKLLIDIEKSNNWNNKVTLMKTTKEKINQEEIKLSLLLETLDDNIKINTKKINFDVLIEDYNKSDIITDKIKIYQTMNSYINKLKNELYN